MVGVLASPVADALEPPDDASVLAGEESPVADAFDPPEAAQELSAYPGGVTVTLESTTPGATLRYTLDGTTPSPSNVINVLRALR